MDKPSQIPVLANKRASMSLTPTVLQQSSTAVNGQERSPSPLLTKNGKRLSLLNGASHVHGGGRKKSIETEDTVHLRAHISKLEYALQAAHARMAEDCRGAGIDASISLSTPVSGSPLPWTPTHGTLDLPELGFTPGNESAIEEEPAEPVRRLPKSNSNYDLRMAASTPRDQRGISQIPRAAVQGAVSLHPSPKQPSPLTSPLLNDSPASTNGRFSPSLHPSGLRKVSSTTSAASTKVIDGLQTELLNTKGHLERVKSEVRSGQRIVASMTRQNSDLVETKERLKSEIETLNGQLQRKERNLQDTVERARKAEAELATRTANQRDLEKTTKKAVGDMKTQMEEAVRKEAKANSECAALRDGVRSMKDAWARDIKGIKDDMKTANERWKAEGEELENKNKALIRLTQEQSSDRTSILTLLDKASAQQTAIRTALEEEVAALRAQVDASAEQSRQANDTASDLQAELTRIRRFMREPRKSLEGSNATDA